MATLGDTCVLHRGGSPALIHTQRAARRVLNEGGAGTGSGMKSLLTMDRSLRQMMISPGGSADLLAATLFVDFLTRRQSKTA
jgi:triphosphoribosyl-dephospho-CoA synthase